MYYKQQNTQNLKAQDSERQWIITTRSNENTTNIIRKSTLVGYINRVYT